MVTYVDDIDCMTQSIPVCTEIANRFKQKYGIKMVSTEHMLGVHRKRTTHNGITTVRLTQPGFIEEQYELYREYLPHREIHTPFPETEFLSMADEDGVRQEVPIEESTEVLQMGYQNLVGALLWSARTCHPEIMLGVNMMQRVMSRPTNRAWKCALHMLKYLHAHRHRGIQYSSNGIQSGYLAISESDIWRYPGMVTILVLDLGRGGCTVQVIDPVGSMLIKRAGSSGADRPK